MAVLELPGTCCLQLRLEEPRQLSLHARHLCWRVMWLRICWRVSPFLCFFATQWTSRIGKQSHTSFNIGFQDASSKCFVGQGKSQTQFSFKVRGDWFRPLVGQRPVSSGWRGVWRPCRKSHHCNHKYVKTPQSIDKKLVLLGSLTSYLLNIYYVPGTVPATVKAMNQETKAAHLDSTFEQFNHKNPTECSQRQSLHLQFRRCVDLLCFYLKQAAVDMNGICFLFST